MTVVNPKSISGITSITTASGSDNLLTIHTSDANNTERLRIDSTGTTKIVTGIVTTLTATGSAKVGTGITLSPDGDVFATGVCTATSFSGDGSALTGIAATDNVRTGILDVAGVGTFRGDVNIPDKIIHLGDTDTAIRFPGADTITTETAGVERARITSEGRLLIGKTSGTAKVDVDASDNTIRITKAAASNYCGFQLDRDNSNNAGGYLGLAGSAGHYIDNAVQHDLCLRSESELLFSTSGNTERFRIDSSGHLVFNNTSTEIRTNTSDGSDNKRIILCGGGDNSQVRGAQITLYGNEYSSHEGRLQLLAGNSGNSNGVIQMYAGGSERLRITSDGNVGIGYDSPSQRLVVHAGADNSTVAVLTGGDVSRGLKISTAAHVLNDQNIIYDAQGQYGQHIFRTGGDTIVGRFEHDQSGFISENVASGDGDTEVGVALQEDYNAWAVIYKNNWIGTGTGWGTFWAGSQGAAYRRESSDNNPNEHVMVGSGQKRFTFDLNDGAAYFDSSLSQNNYDYAEYFEWEDGNPSNEDRRGYSVFVNSNGKIEKATDSTNTSDIIGVISGTAAVLGDGAVYDWQGKWKVDEWGTVMREPAKQVSWKDENDKNHSYDEDKVPDGITIPSHASYKEYTRKILNSDFDETKVYVPRDKRQEWDPVGLLGKVRVRDDSPKNPNWKLIKIVNGKKLWLIR